MTNEKKTNESIAVRDARDRLALLMNNHRINDGNGMFIHPSCADDISLVLDHLTTLGPDSNPARLRIHAKLTKVQKDGARTVVFKDTALDDLFQAFNIPPPAPELDEFTLRHFQQGNPWCSTCRKPVVIRLPNPHDDINTSGNVSAYVHAFQTDEDAPPLHFINVQEWHAAYARWHPSLGPLLPPEPDHIKVNHTIGIENPTVDSTSTSAYRNISGDEVADAIRQWDMKSFAEREAFTSSYHKFYQVDGRSHFIARYLNRRSGKQPLVGSSF